MTTPDYIRQRLAYRHSELTDRLARIEADRQHRTQAPDGNWTERAAERENDEVLDRLAETTTQEIARLRHSLDRLDANLYGICENCSSAIPAERLQSVPEATLCMSCTTDQAAV